MNETQNTTLRVFVEGLLIGLAESYRMESKTGKTVKIELTLYADHLQAAEFLRIAAEVIEAAEAEKEKGQE